MYIYSLLFRSYLEHFVDNLPLETEKKAHKVLQLCEHRSMTDQGRQNSLSVKIKLMEILSDVATVFVPIARS